jgi:hypothetical protein
MAARRFSAPRFIGYIGEPPSIWGKPCTPFVELRLEKRLRLTVAESQYRNVSLASRVALMEYEQLSVG